MSSPPAPALSGDPQRPDFGFDTDAWEDLLNFIEEKRVIPILGPDLLRVQADGQSRLLYDWLAEKLALRLGIDPAELPRPCGLNDVVVRFLARRGRREDAYTRIRSILREASFAPPRSLQLLAEITHFDLFVTTTFDSLLEDALNQVRFGSVRSTEVIAYSPNRVVDLPTEKERLARPVVYHLLGRLSASPSYVISDEDTLEFVTALHSDAFMPEKLFYELEHNHLLIVGNRFPGWLSRLFLRMARRHRLSDPRDVGEVVADDSSSSETSLVLFLQHVSSRTRLFGGAESFVEELHRRWRERLGSVPGGTPDSALNSVRMAPPPREMPDQCVFISYAREDLAAAQRIKASLEAAGVTVWFDFDRLEAGDDYNRRIQRNISRCRLFLPIISANTQRRLEGFFRREWNYAVDRTRSIADSAVFLLPVCVDDTRESGAIVPDAFLSAHWARMPQGQLSDDFIRRIADLTRSRPA